MMSSFIFVEDELFLQTNDKSVEKFFSFLLRTRYRKIILSKRFAKTLVSDSSIVSRRPT